MKDKITDLKIENLKEFEGHPYKVTDNEEMNTLALSIKENGILSPVVVRPIEDTGDYEIISGHRRIFAAKKGRAGVSSCLDLCHQSRGSHYCFGG